MEILVFTSNPKDSESVTRVLRGFDLMIATSKKDLVACLELKKFDVALLDVAGMTVAESNEIIPVIKTEVDMMAIIGHPDLENILIKSDDHKKAVVCIKCLDPVYEDTETGKLIDHDFLFSPRGSLKYPFKGEYREGIRLIGKDWRDALYPMISF